MIQDPQEYLDKWEREHNPFYPSEMRWDRVKVNRFLKDWKEQCNIANVVGRSEQFYCVSSDALVYGKPCKKWCGDEHCKALCKQ